METPLTPELFSQNVSRWSLFNPAAAKRLHALDCAPLSFTTTAQDEINLKNALTEGVYHSSLHALVSAKECFTELKVKNETTLCVYGVGLGYFFEASKEWLNQKPNHLLFFIENDLKVIKMLLHTPLGTELIHHRQVWLFYIPETTQSEDLSLIAGYFILQKYLFTSLPYYQHQDPATCNQLKLWLNYTKIQLDALISEFVTTDGGFFKNFYLNLYQLPHAYLANALFNKFKGIPAIICGAGPSLAKNYAVLENLKDKALIFAGGTAINALNSKSFQPHFGLGIDPNPTQFERLLSTQAFELPFFYRNRMLNSALRLVHGDKLFISGTLGYRIGKWFENALNINETEIEEGHNVVNFAISIAQQLGCNPIILVGVDLAYTEAQSYSFKPLPHAIHPPKEGFVSKSAKETLISKKDIFGKPVFTLEKWIFESHWIAHFAHLHPEILLINCTEGGLGFKNIPNIPLATIAEKFLNTSFDLSSKVHQEIQNSAFPNPVTYLELNKTLSQLESSLKKCFEISKTLSQHYQHYLETNEVNQEEIEKLQNELSHEIGFQEILQTYDTAFMHLNNVKLKRFEIEKGLEKQKGQLLLQRYSVLQHSIRVNLSLIQKAKEEFDSILSQNPPISAVKSSNIPHIPIPEVPEHAERHHTLSERGQLLHEYYTRDGLLQGPSTYYNQQGQLLSLTHFVNNRKQGMCYTLYPNGGLASIQRFDQGKWEGPQAYFYPSGSERSLLNYTQGLLDGHSTLFYPNGKKRREMDFVRGKRHGSEKLWNEAGGLMIAVSYLDDKATGKAKKWYSNGNPELEIDYTKSPPALRRWTMDGIPIPEKVVNKEDYFDEVTKQTHVITDSFTTLLNSLKELVPHADGAQRAELKKIEHTVSEMKLLNDALQKESAAAAEQQNEAIWKSKASEHSMKEYLSVITKQMQSEISQIQLTLKSVLEQNNANEKDTHEK